MPQVDNNLRPVHAAMADARPEKSIVRDLWIEEARRFADVELDGPLYLTLSGAEGKEFSLLEQVGIISFTETGALTPDSALKVVAIENNASAYAQLVTAFPGLKVIREGVHDLVHGNSRIRYPDGERIRLCRSKIINLDLNEAWLPRLIDGEYVIPVSVWIFKLAEMHARTPRLGWTLYLTLHGECPWPEDLEEVIASEVRDSLGADEALTQQVNEWLGGDLLNRICNDDAINYQELPQLQQQKLLMWLVPSFIARHCSNQGWSIRVKQNLHYGRPPDHAPMVTWIIDFQIPRRPLLSFDRELSACLRTILEHAGSINGDGDLSYY